MHIECTINGNERSFEVSKSDLLLDVLRRNGYTGAKRGCDTGACGMCTVQIDGEPTMSCITPVVKADGAAVETIEGLGTQDDLHPVQQAFVDNSALQCGFCIPGMIMRSKALLEENPSPSETEVREALSDNLCRCTGYKKIVEAVLEASERMDDRAVAADGGGVSAECGRSCDCVVRRLEDGSRGETDR
ncbi:(2Fe-2S)-binding protein [Natrinema gelatinilyticum]|uniref:(2Fe-2S)-binding protein n=1 Tax=Natrinema gelatinilyticum TaxID=2961571 RepID=UPI0020C2D3BE|nr:(2Fe-2S)-binding protein [Natrinema gelatinilyticum]